MKINEVVKKTGMTKRTIYFYIEEQFIKPQINYDNGYYIFTDADVERLLLLQQLRKADFSILLCLCTKVVPGKTLRYSDFFFTVP